MSDIFLSYANEDRPEAQRLADALSQCGYTIFWDRAIPVGMTWRQVIGRELADAKSVVVMWSEASIDSNWVHEEADDGQRRGILIPVFTDDVRPPIGFRSIQGADLSAWDGTADDPVFRSLVTNLERLIPTPSGASTATGGGETRSPQRRPAHAGVPAGSGTATPASERRTEVDPARTLHDRADDATGQEYLSSAAGPLTAFVLMGAAVLGPSLHISDDLRLDLRLAPLLPVFAAWLGLRFGPPALPAVAMVGLLAFFAIAVSLGYLQFAFELNFMYYLLALATTLAFSGVAGQLAHAARHANPELSWYRRAGPWLLWPAVAALQLLPPLAVWFTDSFLLEFYPGVAGAFLLFALAVRWGRLRSLLETLCRCRSPRYFWLIISVLVLLALIGTSNVDLDDAWQFAIGGISSSALLAVLCFVLAAWRIVSWWRLLLFVSALHLVPVAWQTISATAQAPPSLEEILIASDTTATVSYFDSLTSAAILLGAAISPVWRDLDLDAVRSAAAVALIVAAAIVDLASPGVNTLFGVTGAAFIAAMAWRTRGVTGIAVVVALFQAPLYMGITNATGATSWDDSETIMLSLAVVVAGAAGACIGRLIDQRPSR